MFAVAAKRKTIYFSWTINGSILYLNLQHNIFGNCRLYSNLYLLHKCLFRFFCPSFPWCCHPMYFFYICLATLASHWFHVNWWSPFISGVYECTLKNNNIAFIQRGTFNVQPTPVIQMTPAVQRIRCANTVTLTCSVSPSPPYQVEFKGITPGKPETNKTPKRKSAIENYLHINLVLRQLFEIMCTKWMLIVFIQVDLLFFVVLGPSITYTANTASCTEQTFTCQVTTSTQNFTKSITLSFVMGSKYWSRHYRALNTIQVKIFSPVKIVLKMTEVKPFFFLSRLHMWKLWIWCWKWRWAGCRFLPKGYGWNPDSSLFE